MSALATGFDVAAPAAVLLARREVRELARRLHIKTVAEWVQDEPAAEMLAAWGCDYLQGALVGRAALERPWAGSTPRPSAVTA